MKNIFNNELPLESTNDQSTMNFKNHFYFILFLISIVGYCQTGIVSGQYLDPDGDPALGVNVIVKGTNRGTQTDFDGNYSIECSIGEILEFSSALYVTKEVLVTPQMFNLPNTVAPLTRVDPITSNAYQKAIMRQESKKDTIPDITKAQRTFNLQRNYFTPNRIKKIQFTKDRVKLTYFKPNIFFEIAYDSGLGVHYVRDTNIPLLQSEFSQGISQNGELSFLGADANNPFSYGPALNSLEYDGSNYPFDINGLLVPLGNGNGKRAIVQDNSILNTFISNFHNLSLGISSSVENMRFSISHLNRNDIFNNEANRNNGISFTYDRRSNKRAGFTKVFVDYQNAIINQPNINGFTNNLLLNSWITPVSFQNDQGTFLANNSQRSFNTDVNNPGWLFRNNDNSIKNHSFILKGSHKLQLNEDLEIKASMDYLLHKQDKNFSLTNGTAGFNEGFKTTKGIHRNRWNPRLNLNYDNNSIKYDKEFSINSNISLIYENMDFYFFQGSGYQNFTFNNPLNQVNRDIEIDRNLFEIENTIRYKPKRGIQLDLGFNSYVSSIQNNEWLLPSLSTNINISDVFDLYGDFRNIYVSASISRDVNDLDLYYSNLSHNSLLLTPDQSQSYTTNNDLFISNQVSLEELISIDFNTGVEFSFDYYNQFSLDINYYNKFRNGAVFPFLNDDGFQLDNIADIQTNGIELSFSSSIGRTYDGFNYYSSLSFHHYTSSVKKIYADSRNIPIAGFSTISQNLIEGQSTGAIVGTSFRRDSNGNLLIGADGFPIVNDELAVIGDPIPDFNLGFTNAWSYKGLRLEIILDIQKGGDVWNGTQNVLNYFGTSQQSADDRGIMGFIYDGVTASGNPNNIPVDFYNPANSILENRFVRYGYEGIAEEAIVDASYLNVRSISLDYYIKRENNSDPSDFFKSVKVSIYGNNLFTWSKFRNNNPYSSLFGHSLGQALNFFNTPLVTEVGMNINFKI